MVGILSQILPEALATAIMPIAIIALILMLSTPNARTNGILFTLGAFLATLAILIVGALVGNLQSSDGSAGPSLIGSLIKTALGLFMLYLAFKQWQARPKKGETVEVPGWMKALDQFTAGKSFTTGVALAVVNPKNLPILLAVAVVIAQSGLGLASNLIVAILFSLVSVSLLIIPLVFYLIAGQKAVDALDGFKDWLIANNNTIMFILFLIVGAKILGSGIAGLF
jgi:threonine/homoserine/homoserine lactone efflux protein